jgi:hypothetical protein
LVSNAGETFGSPQRREGAKDAKVREDLSSMNREGAKAQRDAKEREDLSSMNRKGAKIFLQ